jgi:hypothetical protein
MKKLSLILMSILALGLMASCSSSDDNTTNVNNNELVKGTKTLTLNIVGAQPMSGRSMGSFSTEEGNPLQVGGNEATINNLIVIVYDNATGKFETANKFANPNVNNNEISVKAYFNSTSPSVFVLANVPLNTVDGIVGQNLDAFKALTASLNLTSITGDASGTSQVPTNLPMVGSTTTLTAINATPTNVDFSATVTLHRMVSRVALTSFTTNFSTTGESFTITDVFLKHVNTTSNFLHADVAADAAKATMNGAPTLGALHDGLLVGNPSSVPSIANYLETSYQSTAWNNGPTGGTPAYFYVFPNDNSSFDAKTQLVIKGLYKANDNSSPEERYYVCVVNAVPDGTKVTYTAPTGGSLPSDAGSGTVAANRKYSLKVTVTGTPQIPSDVAQDVDPNPIGTNNVQLTIEVAEWAADIIQNVSF